MHRGGGFDRRHGGPHRHGRAPHRGGRGNVWANRSELERNGIMVTTNCFPVRSLQPDPRGQRFYTQYQVQIYRLRWKYKELPPIEGETIDPLLKPRRQKDCLEIDTKGNPFFVDPLSADAQRTNRSSPNSRRILNKCQQMLQTSTPPQEMFHDGGSIAWSREPLVPVNGVETEPDAKRTRVQYEPKPKEVSFDVCIKRNCDDDHPHADRAKNDWFRVAFAPTAVCPFNLKNRQVTLLLNIALRNSMMLSGMKAFGRSPMFVFPKEYQHELLSQSSLASKLNNATIPMLGLTQSFRHTSNHEGKQGQMLDADICLGFAHNDKSDGPPARKFKLLDVSSGNQNATLAGVRITNVHAQIPFEQRAEVGKAFKAIIFDAAYEIGNGTWARKKTETRGKEWVDQHRTFVRPNLKLFRGPPEEPSILWNDPGSIRTFDVGGATMTEEEYFRTTYGLQIQYPKMPLVRVSKSEYYPVELLYQAFQEVRGANSNEQVQDTLSFFDTHSVRKRIDRIASLVHPKQSDHFQSALSDSLRKLQLEVDTEPKSTRAKVLNEPKLYCNPPPAEGVRDDRVPLRINNGKCNQGDMLAHPAEMLTFAIIDFTRNNSCMKVVLNDCRSYGLTQDDPERHMNEVTVSCDLPSRLADTYRAFAQVIDRSRTHFINELGTELDCKDPLGNIFRCRVRRTSDGSIWVTPPGRDEVLYDVTRVNCPSIVFVLIPEKDSRQHCWIKKVGGRDFGVSTQVIVSNRNTDIYKKSKAIAREVNAKLSSLKKTSAAWLVERPGMRSVDNWVTQAPTLVIGLSTASSQGQNSKMVVVGTAMLDVTGTAGTSATRIQQKAAIIAQVAMAEIIEALAWEFSQYNGRPQRVIIYRSGGDDGLFEEILTTELRAVKHAFVNLYQTDQMECKYCSRKGCVCCLPRITMVVAQSNHSIIFVPKDYNANVPSGTCVDETSGLFAELSLDRDKMPGFNELVEEDNAIAADCNFMFPEQHNGGSAFALVPQDGLKGTSKSVLYRVIWNENVKYAPSSGPCTPLTDSVLQQLTYWQSFQYATASKAPRLPAVLQNATRWANVTLGICEYSFDQDGPRPLQPLPNDKGLYAEANGDRRVMPAFSSINGPPIEGDGYPDTYTVAFHPHVFA